jgi:hypothetical protein
MDLTVKGLHAVSDAKGQVLQENPVKKEEHSVAKKEEDSQKMADLLLVLLKEEQQATVGKPCKRLPYLTVSLHTSMINIEVVPLINSDRLRSTPQLPQYLNREMPSLFKRQRGLFRQILQLLKKR